MQASAISALSSTARITPCAMSRNSASALCSLRRSVSRRSRRRLHWFSWCSTDGGASSSAYRPASSRGASWVVSDSTWPFCSSGWALAWAAPAANKFQRSGLPDQVRMHAPDGIVCAGFFEPELLSALRAAGKPLVLIDMKLRGYSSVNPDNLAGGQLATRHLIALGRRRIALIAGPLGHYSIRERARGYRQALFDAGMLADPALEAYLPDSADLDAGAREAMQSLLELPERPDAVFCYNDSAALAALRCCLAAGLRVPEDIAIAGCDDIAGAQLATPPLTTLRIDKQALGALGVELLLAGPHDTPRDMVAPVELVIRASSAGA